MSEGWIFIAVILLTVILAAVLRKRYFSEGTPLRAYFDAVWRPRFNKLVQAIFLITVVVWIALWATADDEARTRLTHDFGKFLKEQGFAPEDEAQETSGEETPNQETKENAPARP